MGNPPKRVFIEMAREKTDQGRTSSRKKKLLELYKKCKAEEKDWIDEIEKRSDAEMRRDKLYLYYTQKGKCMYSRLHLNRDTRKNRSISRQILYF